MGDRIEELIWESQDGEISGEERARLAESLENDPAARSAAALAQTLSARLAEAGREEPVPPELRPRIQAALALARREPRRGSLLASLSRLLLPPAAPRLHYVTAALCGMLLGAAVVWFLQSERLGPLPEPELYGTISTPAGGGVEIEIAEGAGILKLARNGPLLLAEAVLATDTDELRIRGGGLAVRGFEALPGSAARLESSAQEIVVRQLGAGRHRLILELGDPGLAIELSVHGSGRLLLRREIRPADL